MEPEGRVGHLKDMKAYAGVALAVGTVLLLTACGGSGSGDVTASPQGDGSASGHPSGTQLTIVVRDDGETPSRTYTLGCDPASGDHPAAEEACRLLDGLADAFAPVPDDAICTEIYGGPQTATVTGRWRGEPVDTTFRRHNGCEIARWDKHAVLFREPPSP